MIMFALFADKAFMGIESEPTEQDARTYIRGCARGARMYEREMTGYVLPVDEKLMRENEDETECDRAMDDFKGQKVT